MTRFISTVLSVFWIVAAASGWVLLTDSPKPIRLIAVLCPLLTVAGVALAAYRLD